MWIKELHRWKRNNDHSRQFRKKLMGMMETDSWSEPSRWAVLQWAQVVEDIIQIPSSSHRPWVYDLLIIKEQHDCPSSLSHKPDWRERGRNNLCPLQCLWHSKTPKCQWSFRGRRESGETCQRAKSGHEAYERHLPSIYRIDHKDFSIYFLTGN